jgi:hypothetical protein
MKKIFIVLLGTLTTLMTAQARLGESVEQCKARYGEPQRVSLDESVTGVATYSKNDLTITIHFLNGKANLVRYSPGLVSTVDFELAEYLLTINGRNKEWEQLTKTEIVLQDIQDQNAQHPRVQMVDPILWKSKDNLIDASFSVSKGAFEVRASTFQERIRRGL